MKRSDWILVLLHLPGGSGEENEAMDRIRIVKSLFLLGKEIEDLQNFYDFRPYLYGPFSLDIYRDLDEVAADRYVRLEVAGPMNWSRYSLTAEGTKKAKDASQEIPPPTLEKMKEIKTLVQGFSFLDLLRHIYRRYPEYAKGSVITVS